MADIFDRASEREIMDRDAAIARARRAAVQARPEPKGFCLNCEEDFPPEAVAQLYCDADCSMDHSRRLANKR